MSKKPVVTDGQIAELLDPQLLETHIRNRVINRRSHPRLPLAILNYGQKAQFEQLLPAQPLQQRRSRGNEP